MFQGLRTVIYGVADIEAAKKWYSAALGFGPYFDQPYYVGFSVGGYELGVVPNTKPPAKASTGAVAYWCRKHRGGVRAAARPWGERT